MQIKKGLDIGKKSTYKIKFIDSFRFMSSPLSNLVDIVSLILNIYQPKKMNY